MVFKSNLWTGQVSFEGIFFSYDLPVMRSVYFKGLVCPKLKL